jgi:spore coat protein U domain-containing protein, fimbrial subunit CupE1/2/3/6
MDFMLPSRRSAVIAALAFAGCATVPQAGSILFSHSTTANLTVSATVSVNCAVTAGTLAFGAYDPVVTNASSNRDASGTFTVACTKNATGVTIDLGRGSNYSSGRRMAASGNYLSYQMYSNSARTSVWGSTSGGSVVNMSAPTSMAAVTYTVHGRIASGQDVPAGSYTDTVVATINF